MSLSATDVMQKAFVDVMLQLVRKAALMVLSVKLIRNVMVTNDCSRK